MKLHFSVLVWIITTIFSLSTLPHGFEKNTLITRADGKSTTFIKRLVHKTQLKPKRILSYAADTQSVHIGHATAGAVIHTNGYCIVHCSRNTASPLLCSPTQELYVFERTAFVPAYKLKPGQHLLNAYGDAITVTHVDLVRSPITLYAITVEDTQTYFVGPQQVLTHNMELPMSMTVAIGKQAAATTTTWLGRFAGPLACVGVYILGKIITWIIHYFSSDDGLNHYVVHHDLEKTNVLFQEHELQPSGTALSPSIPKQKTPQEEAPVLDEKIDKQKLPKTVEDILKDAKKLPQKNSGLKQYEKEGEYRKAVSDFEDLQPTDIRVLEEGAKRIGKLPDGRIVNARIKSSYKLPTLEIYSPQTTKSIKIRYFQ